MYSAFIEATGGMVGDDEADQAWMYVGRFLWGFSAVESALDRLFGKLFNLNEAATLMFLPNLPFYKKLELVELGLKHQGSASLEKISSRLKKLNDIRVVVAHAGFWPHEPFDDVEKHGIDFFYINKRGKGEIPHRPKTKEGEKLSDTMITYSEFEFYDEEACQLSFDLGEVCDAVSPIENVKDDKEFAIAIAKAIESSVNIIPFPKRMPTKDKDD